MATKQKSSTAASKPQEPDAPVVLLRNLDNQESKPFEPAHAERLLALRGTRWALVAEPEADPTGHPTEV